MNKELSVSVDEFSLVLFCPTEDVGDDWGDLVHIMINEFICLSKIGYLLGSVVETKEKKPKAYSQALTIEDVPYYFAIAFHDTFQHMGILVRFTAHSWAVYQQKYFDLFGKRINIAEFLKMIESPIYTYRLSRIDLTADYKNYADLSPHNIYNKLKDESYCILDCKERNAKRKISAIENNMQAETFYIGSRAENSPLLLRIYNKKSEQINTNGFRLEEALNCDSWTRFEVSYKGRYAHQITEQLESVKSDIELTQFIASKICDKYRFSDVLTNEYTDFTSDLLALIDNSEYPALRTENPANYNLNKSIAHIISGSGLFPLLYKIGFIWGNQAEIQCLGILYEIYVKYHKRDFDRNSQIQSWLKKNCSTLSNQKLEDCFVSIDLSKVDVLEIVRKLSEYEDLFKLKKISLAPEETENEEVKLADEQISSEEFNHLFTQI